jgi:purine-nucleoside phosphorylase
MHPVDRDAEKKRIREAADYLLSRTPLRPRTAMLLGTGHDSFVGRLKNTEEIQAHEIPGWPRLAAEETGALLFGELAGVPLLVADAPLSVHAGFTARELAVPVWVLKAMGVQALVLTAGAAALTPAFELGGLALVEDHINLAALTPLAGLHDDTLGPRFPDMTEPYANNWRLRARNVAREANFPCREGVLAFVHGPSLPTRAEYRFLRTAGADLVGMSTVPEVLAAVHAGMEVLAVLGITQTIDLEAPRPTTLEEMLDAASLAAPRITSLLTGVVEGIAKLPA